MNVSGIRPYSGFYQYNSIKLDELRNQQIEDVETQEGLSAANVEDIEAMRKKQDEEIAAAAAKQTYDSYDFAQQYRLDETFDLKGMDSDINRLDMEKAVSDLEKDQVLRQYQYFVGPKGSAEQEQASVQNAVLRSGENFSL